jgi:hypothetical protein
MEVVGNEIIVSMVFNPADQCAECVRIAKSVFLDFVKDSLKVGVNGVRAISMSVAEVFDVFGKVAKEEDVVFSDFSSNFNLK